MHNIPSATILNVWELTHYRYTVYPMYRSPHVHLINITRGGYAWIKLDSPNLLNTSTLHRCVRGDTKRSMFYSANLPN